MQVYKTSVKKHIYNIHCPDWARCTESPLTNSQLKNTVLCNEKRICKNARNTNKIKKIVLKSLSAVNVAIAS